MPLLNYTTTVDAVRTVSDLQAMLAKAGARQIMAEYDDKGAPSGLGFAINTEYGLRSFVLPVDVAAVEGALRRSAPPRFQSRAQAERVAWRILKDWIEAQLAIIETKMVTLDQVMLPYMRTGVEGQTVYKLFREQQLALPAG